MGRCTKHRPPILRKSLRPALSASAELPSAMPHMRPPSPCAETRAKMARAHLGKTHSEETRVKIGAGNRATKAKKRLARCGALAQLELAPSTASQPDSKGLPPRGERVGGGVRGEAMSLSL
jgi:hypothetical protein